MVWSNSVHILPWLRILGLVVSGVLVWSSVGCGRGIAPTPPVNRNVPSPLPSDHQVPAQDESLADDSAAEKSEASPMVNSSPREALVDTQFHQPAPTELYSRRGVTNGNGENISIMRPIAPNNNADALPAYQVVQKGKVVTPIQTGISQGGVGQVPIKGGKAVDQKGGGVVQVITPDQTRILQDGGGHSVDQIPVKGGKVVDQKGGGVVQVITPDQSGASQGGVGQSVGQVPIKGGKAVDQTGTLKGGIGQIGSSVSPGQGGGSKGKGGKDGGILQGVSQAKGKGKGSIIQDGVGQAGKGKVTGTGKGGKGSPAVPAQPPDHSHTVVQFMARDLRARQHDILWVVENGNSMVRHEYHTIAASQVRNFVRQYASDDYQMGLITAQHQEVEFCVPRIHKPNVDLAWLLDVSLVKQPLVKMNCAIETLSPLLAIQKFFENNGGLAGVDVQEFVRPGAQATIIVVSDGFALKSHQDGFKQAVLSHYPQSAVSFYSFSATGIRPDKSEPLEFDSSVLTAAYDGGEVYYHGRCGHYYTQTYSDLAAEFGGRVFGVCEQDWTPHFEQIMVDLEQKSYQQYSLSQLQGQAFSLLDVKVNGTSVLAEDFWLDPQDPPILYFTKPMIANESSEIELVIQLRP